MTHYIKYNLFNLNAKFSKNETIIWFLNDRPTLYSSDFKTTYVIRNPNNYYQLKTRKRRNFAFKEFFLLSYKISK